MAFALGNIRRKILQGIFDQPNWQLGNGTGVASLGVQYVTKLVGARPLNVGAESGYGILIVEFGIVGPFIVDYLDC